jgi:hypothetical protein
LKSELEESKRVDDGVITADGDDDDDDNDGCAFVKFDIPELRSTMGWMYIS